MDELSFQEQFKPGGPVTVADVLARALATPDRAELEQAAAERAAAEALAERRETTAMLNRMRGDPLGQVSRAQAAVAQCRDEVTDLEARLDAARGRLHRAAESLVDWSATADEVMSASARRSGGPDLLAEAKRTMAALKVEQMLAAPRPERPPFGRGGHAARSEPVTCSYCLACGFTPEQSFEVHHTDADGRPVSAAADMAGDGQEAGRGGYGSYAEIRR